ATDARIQFPSDAIDGGYGSDPDTPVFDYEGTPRPQGSIIDIGAFEYGGPDTTVPTRSKPQPNGTLSPGTTSTNISLSTNVQAICRYSNNSGTNYTNMTGSFTYTNSTNHSTPVIGLENGKTYVYYVRCNSTEGYVNVDDFNISFSIDGHKADINDDGVINMHELIAFIARWKACDGVTRAEVEEARDIWFAGGGYGG
ncbi:MAG: choice-of-anchor Q domain-containing protein, partial [Candidatus Altiarchaeota archaeon]|nr:choice-of-anchor Q domain-containing protein [Candidatus Altiarchaeota archaeon]